MKKELTNTSLAFGVISMLYNVVYGVLFGFLINVIIAIIEAAAKADGTWTTVYFLGGFAVLASALVNLVALFFVKRKPLVSGILFTVTCVVVSTYAILTLVKLFSVLTLVFAVLAIAFEVVAMATAFAAHQDMQAHQAPQVEQSEQAE